MGSESSGDKVIFRTGGTDFAIENKCLQKAKICRDYVCLLAAVVALYLGPAGYSQKLAYEMGETEYKECFQNSIGFLDMPAFFKETFCNITELPHRMLNEQKDYFNKYTCTVDGVQYQIRDIMGAPGCAPIN